MTLSSRPRPLPESSGWQLSAELTGTPSPARARADKVALVTAGKNLPANADFDWRIAWLVGALGFFGMIPYPGLPVGTNTSLVIGNVIVVALILPALFADWRKVPLFFFAVILGPMLLSTVKVALFDDLDLALSFKVLATVALAVLTLIPVQMHLARYSLELLTGIALAAVAHSIVGIWQFLVFPTGTFPLVELYINPSFLSVQAHAKDFALYEQRPFGLFPEPSAMSTSLAPWVLFFFAHAAGIVQLIRKPSRWQNVLFFAAGIGSLALIIMSQSGLAGITLALLAPLVLLWLFRCRATIGNFLAVSFGLSVIVPVVVYATSQALASRVGGGAYGNSSWQERSTSLIYGFQSMLNGNIGVILFGFGAGQTTPLIARAIGIDAVFSISLVYFYEHGLVGLAAMGWIGRCFWRSWSASGRNITFVVMLLVWLVGITVGTSYPQLLTIWLTMGWLAEWKSVCQNPSAVSVQSVSPGFVGSVRRRRSRIKGEGWRAAT